MDKPSLELEGKHVVYCVCSSVAAIKAPEIARGMVRRGAKVTCVISEPAKDIIGVNALEWASGNKVIDRITGMAEHVLLAGGEKGGADALLIAPCTTATIGKIANGISDTNITLFALTALGSRIPIVIAPAMHLSLYNQPIVAENVKKLEENGVVFVGPKIEEGKAKLVDTEDIIDHVVRAVYKKTLAGKRVVVSAGATREKIDDVRFLSNPSSGKMGIELAREAWLRGADVILYKGNVSVRLPNYIKKVDAPDFSSMKKIVNEKADFMLLAAAVGDFAPEKHDGKIPSESEIVIRLKPNPKIYKNAKAKCLVIFKAECNANDEQLLKAMQERIEEGYADIVIGNDVMRKGCGFGSDYNRIILLKKGCSPVKLEGSKRELAKRIWDAILHQKS
ncbi:MAG: bifunctional phosphopantothenoylcysteine decarboxylase/phosphopantothenate--cysteine ligase CoaBC [Candidatus Micrarchaeia archaeon]